MAEGAVVVARFNSTKKPSNIYDVKREADGTLWCSCPGWRFNKDTPKACRHTRLVLEGAADDSERLARTPRLLALCDALEETLFLTRSGGWPEAVRREIVTPMKPAPGRVLSSDAARVLAQRVDRLLTALDASGLFTGPAPQAQAVGRPVSRRQVRLITLED